MVYARNINYPRFFFQLISLSLSYHFLSKGKHHRLSCSSELLPHVTLGLFTSQDVQYFCCPLEQFSISLCSVQHATLMFIILSIHRNIKGSIIQIFFYAQNHEDGLDSAMLSCNCFFFFFFLEGSTLCLCLYMKMMSTQMSFQDVGLEVQITAPLSLITSFHLAVTLFFPLGNSCSAPRVLCLPL